MIFLIIDVSTVYYLIWEDTSQLVDQKSHVPGTTLASPGLCVCRPKPISAAGLRCRPKACCSLKRLWPWEDQALPLWRAQHLAGRMQAFVSHSFAGLWRAAVSSLQARQCCVSRLIHFPTSTSILLCTDLTKFTLVNSHQSISRASISSTSILHLQNSSSL